MVHSKRSTAAWAGEEEGGDTERGREPILRRGGAIGSVVNVIKACLVATHGARTARRRSSSAALQGLLRWRLCGSSGCCSSVPTRRPRARWAPSELQHDSQQLCGPSNFNTRAMSISANGIIRDWAAGGRTTMPASIKVSGDFLFRPCLPPSLPPSLSLA